MSIAFEQTIIDIFNKFDTQGRGFLGPREFDAFMKTMDKKTNEIDFKQRCSFFSVNDVP